MLTQEERTRLGGLISRVDLSAEENRELEQLRQRAYVQARGEANADFDAVKDQLLLIPITAAAKQRMPANFALHDPELFIHEVERLKREGYTVRQVA